MLTHTRTKPKELPRRKAAGPIRARVRDELAPLGDCWPDTNLYPASPAPSFAWLNAARFAFSESAELRTITAERDRTVLAAAVLTATGQGLMWRWVPLGSELGEPTDLAGDDSRALERLAGAIVRLGQPVVFERLPGSSQAVAAIRRAARGRAVVLRQGAEPELGIEVDESWVRPERHLPPAERRQLQRAQREAERLGGVSTEIHAPDLFELPGLLDQVFQCEGSLRDQDDQTLARQMSSIVFFRHYCEAACMAGVLRIGRMRIADRVAAAAIAIEQGTTLWLLRVACNPRYESCQPGQILVREMLSYSAEAGIRRCELWGERHDWLHAWPIDSRPCVRLSIYPLSIAGAATAAVDGITACWRGVTRSLCGTR